MARSSLVCHPVVWMTAPSEDRPAPPGAPQAPLLEMRGITKRYPGVVANNDISLDVRAGEIHALLGENGARPMPSLSAP